MIIITRRKLIFRQIFLKGYSFLFRVINNDAAIEQYNSFNSVPSKISK